MEEAVELLKVLAAQAVMECTDADLLDFVYKLLLNG